MGDIVSSLKSVIIRADNLNSFMKALNLDIESSFLCLIRLLEDAVLDYRDGYDYSYLIKVSDYIEKIYFKLSINKRESHRSNILLLRKIYKKEQGNFLKKDKVYFEKVYNTLNSILENNKKNIEEVLVEEVNMYEFLYEIIFKMQKLEYLDKVIESFKGVLNSKNESESIFAKVINAYIKEMVMSNYEMIDYYEKVMNKFLLEETFDLNDQMKDNIIKTLYDFINSKRNLSSKLLKRIKVLIDGINNKSNLFSLFNIQTKDSKVDEDDIDFMDKHRNLEERVRINEYIITVDDADSKVLDDAISYKKLKNGNSIFRVHIADPLAILPYDSNTLQEAKRRVSTIYYKDNSINMIPLMLSLNKLSLVLGEERYAKTFCYELDSDFNIIDFYVLNSIIKVSDRLSFDSLNKIYQKGGRTKKEEELLVYYDNILNLLRRSLSQVENYHDLKEKIGNRHSGTISSFADRLVSYSMILTGYMTSKHFFLNNLPYIYRCNNIDYDWLDLLDKTIENSSNIQEKKSLKILKSHLPKSYYSRENKGHMGLGLDYYSHITSPLRRFSDILNMHALNFCYFKNPSDKEIYELESEIDRVCSYINMQSNIIDEIITTGGFDKILKK